MDWAACWALGLLKDPMSSDSWDFAGPAQVSSHSPLNQLIRSSGRKECSSGDRAMWYHPFWKSGTSLPYEDFREGHQETERWGRVIVSTGWGRATLSVDVDKNKRRGRAFAEEGTGPSFSFNLFQVISYICIYMNVLPPCMSVCHLHAVPTDIRRWC